MTIPKTSSHTSYESFRTRRLRDRVKRRNNRGKTSSPKAVLEVTGEPVSQWKKDDLLGTYHFVENDATGRPIYKREALNSLNKTVHLFYRVESEKWCLGPEPTGTYCWIYCDSKAKMPWMKTLRPFWFEHTGANNWANIPIIIKGKS